MYIKGDNMKVNGVNRFDYSIAHRKTAEFRKISVFATPNDEFTKTDDKTTTVSQESSVAFKGKGRMLGGLLGGTTGTLAGIGLGALITLGTGGLAAPLIAGMAGCALGSASGSEIGDKLDDSPQKNDDDYDSDYESENVYP